MRADARGIAPLAQRRGFTLLEVMVALSILAMSLAAILRVFTASTSATRVSQDYYTALQVAETQLALAAEEDGPLRGGRGEVDDRYRWEVEVREYRPAWDDPLWVRVEAAADAGQPEEAPVVPYHYQVTVRWGERRERELQLSTIRLGAAR